MSDSIVVWFIQHRRGALKNLKRRRFVPKGMVSFAFSVKPVAVRVKAYV